MTTYQVPEDQALADALTLVIKHLGTDREAVRAVAELRSAATPGNGFRVAHVPSEHGGTHPVRIRIAEAVRAAAADGHPLAGQLEGLAEGLAPGTAPKPASAPVPATAPEAPPAA